MGEHDLQTGPVHEKRQMGEHDLQTGPVQERRERERHEPNKWVENPERRSAKGRNT